MMGVVMGVIGKWSFCARTPLLLSLVSRITRIFEMTFSLDNFDVNFLHCLCVNRFVSALTITIIIIYL